jgi:hypothetical protein
LGAGKEIESRKADGGDKIRTIPGLRGETGVEENGIVVGHVSIETGTLAATISACVEERAANRWAAMATTFLPFEFLVGRV